MELMVIANDRQRIRPVRVLLALRPRMLRHLLRDVFASNREFEVVGEVENLANLADAVKATSPTAVFVSVAQSGGDPDICRHLLCRYPGLKAVINLSQDSRHGYASRVSIQTKRLEEVSLESIIAAVREDREFWDDEDL
jgi:DNA-binding NarL/FixJ family response regulator